MNCDAFDDLTTLFEARKASQYIATYDERLVSVWAMHVDARRA